MATTARDYSLVVVVVLLLLRRRVELCGATRADAPKSAPSNAFSPLLSSVSCPSVPVVRSREHRARPCTRR